MTQARFEALLRKHAEHWIAGGAGTAVSVRRRALAVIRILRALADKIELIERTVRP